VKEATAKDATAKEGTAKKVPLQSTEKDPEAVATKSRLKCYHSLWPSPPSCSSIRCEIQSDL
jgi:hypothetical protein